MAKKTFEQILDEQGRLIYTNVGDSMYPLVQPRDLLVIEKTKLPLKQFDIPLYKRDSGQYVLHRVVEVSGREYVMCGDNRTGREYGITDRHILGVLTHIVRNGKTLTLEEAMNENLLKIAGDLIYLVSCALSDTQPDIVRCKKMNLPELYRMAHTHSLTSAAAFALEKVAELPHAFDQSKKKAIRKLSLFEIERTKIFREFDKAGIWYLPLKGIVMKDFYPKSAMREMTDNDILCDSTKMAEIKDIMERFGYSCDNYEYHIHDVYSKPPTLEFEMHHALFDSERDPMFYGYFKNIREKLLPDGGYRLKMTDEDFYIYILAHSYKHYSEAGTGLRTLADFFLFNKSKGGSLDRGYLDRELEKTGLAEFEQKLTSLANKAFENAELNDDEKNMLMYLIRSGSRGIESHAEYHQLLKQIGGDDADTKRSYLKSRVFISGKSLKKNYPFVYKHKALYPLLLVYRPIKGVLTHPKTIITEYKKVKRFKKRKDMDQ